MSDEDMNGAPDMGGESGSDMGDDDFAPPSNELPDGITKEIITEASPESVRSPKTGDIVQVHYVGTLESDGSEFDSSRSRGKPFDFTLGQGQVIKGWDLGVASMKKGEIAKFVLAPEFAYGADGSPPKIPENATLVFEVELLSWTSQDDLFNDGSVIKATLVEGTGWKKPKSGDEVQLSFAALKEGSCKYDGKQADYVIGSGSFGAFASVIDKALEDMKKGEETELKCTPEYVASLRGKDEAVPEGAENLTLTLHEVYDVSDVSLSKDKSIMKKQVREGDGYDKPKESNKVTLQVLDAVDGQSNKLPGFSSTTLNFEVGNGEVCDALEFAICEMKKGERALLTCARPKQCQEPKVGLQEIKADKVVLTVQLDEFEKGKDTWSMSEDEKLQHGEARKATAGNLFKAQRTELALKSYSSIISLFNYVDNFEESNKIKATNLKRLCELNKAACFLKTSDWEGARKCCDTVLKEDKKNIKALFRRATANKELGEYQDAMKDCKFILEEDRANADVRKLIPMLKDLQKIEDNKSKNMFANMCKGLGKLNTPEPQVAKPVVPEDEDEEEEEDDEEDVPMDAGKENIESPSATAE